MHKEIRPGASAPERATAPRAPERATPRDEIERRRQEQQRRMTERELRRWEHKTTAAAVAALGGDPDEVPQ